MKGDAIKSALATRLEQALQPRRFSDHDPSQPEFQQMLGHKPWGPPSLLPAKIPVFPQQILHGVKESLQEPPLWVSPSPLSQPRALPHGRDRALTAMVFSLIPPTGRIFPVNDTSPVMATFCLTGQFMASDSRAVTMVQPALGPSLGVAPCLKKKHKPAFSSFQEQQRQTDNTFVIAVLTLPPFQGVSKVFAKASLLFELADQLKTGSVFTLFMENNPQVYNSFSGLMPPRSSSGSGL